MKEYKIVSVIWEDHTSFSRSELPPNDNLEKFIRPSLTVGLLYKNTERFIIVIYNLERYDSTDEADFMLIFSDSIISIQEHGTIKLKKLRHKGG